MRSSGVVVGALLLGTSLVVGPMSVADPGAYVVRAPGEFPSWDLNPSQLFGAVERIPCADPLGTASGPGADVTYHQDAAAPLGERVWQVDDAAGELGTAVGPAVFDPNADSLTVATVDLESSSATTGKATVLVVDPNTFQGWVGFTDLPATTDGWQTVSSSGLVYHWRSYDVFNQTHGDTDVAQATYESFMQPKGFNGYAAFTFAYGCEARASFRTDRWTVGHPWDSASMYTYDLEGPHTRVAMGGSRPTVTAGRRLTLTGDLADAELNAPLQGSLQLEAMPYGTSDFAPVTSAETGPAGEPASTTVRPKVATTYRWVYAPSDCCEGSTSEPFTVEVRTAVTSALADTTVRKGRSLVLSGRTRPAKPGTTVTLWRRTATSSKQLTSGHVKDDGTYRLATKATSKGTWKLFATVAAASGNLAGTSPLRTAKVS